MPTNDHDLLIELRTEMRGMRIGLKEMKDDTVVRLASLEKDVSALKFWRGALVGAWGVVTLILIPIIAAYVQSGRI